MPTAVQVPVAVNPLEWLPRSGHYRCSSLNVSCAGLDQQFSSETNQSPRPQTTRRGPQDRVLPLELTQLNNERSQRVVSSPCHSRVDAPVHNQQLEEEKLSRSSCEIVESSTVMVCSCHDFSFQVIC